MPKEQLENKKVRALRQTKELHSFSLPTDRHTSVYAPSSTLTITTHASLPHVPEDKDRERNSPLGKRPSFKSLQKKHQEAWEQKHGINPSPSPTPLTDATVTDTDAMRERENPLRTRESTSEDLFTGSSVVVVPDPGPSSLTINLDRPNVNKEQEKERLYLLYSPTKSSSPGSTTVSAKKPSLFLAEKKPALQKLDEEKNKICCCVIQ